MPSLPLWQTELRGRYLEPPEGFEGLTGDELYEAQAGRIDFQMKSMHFSLGNCHMHLTHLTILLEDFDPFPIRLRSSTRPKCWETYGWLGSLSDMVCPWLS